MGLTNVWVQTQSDGLVRADQVVGSDAHQTPGAEWQAGLHPDSGHNAGVQQRRLEVGVDEIGPSPRWAEAEVSKVSSRVDEVPVEDEPPF